MHVSAGFCFPPAKPRLSQPVLAVEKVPLCILHACICMEAFDLKLCGLHARASCQLSQTMSLSKKRKSFRGWNSSCKEAEKQCWGPFPQQPNQCPEGSRNFSGCCLRRCILSERFDQGFGQSFFREAAKECSCCQESDQEAP